jgi:PLD-like domain
MNMARADIARRLLRRLKLSVVKRLSEYHGVPKRKSAEDTIDELMPKVRGSISNIVIKDGPLSFDEWNEILVTEFQGARRKSFDAIAADIEFLLHPAFDSFSNLETVSNLRNISKADLKKFALSLSVDEDELANLLERSHGSTKVGSFVSQVLMAKSGLIKIASSGNVQDSNKNLKQKAEKSPTEALDLDWIADELSGWSCIDIAAGFYDIAFIEQLFNKVNGANRVRLLFNGLRGYRKNEQRENQEKLKKNLEAKFGSGKVEIKFAYSPGLFHTKLFLGRTEPFSKALIGSANATLTAMDKNEEILLSLANAESLSAYFDFMWDKSSEVNADALVNSLVSFFRTGVLYFKPQANLAVTFNPFAKLLESLTPAERKKINQKDIPFSDETAGIGPVSLIEILKSKGTTFETDASDKLRISIKSKSVETCYGYWMPSAVSENFQKVIEGAENEKVSYLRALGLELKRHRADINLCFDQYYSKAIDAITLGVGADKLKYHTSMTADDLKASYASLFEKFLDRTIQRLGNSSQVDLLARRFLSGVVPDFWDDVLAYNEFRESFFASLYAVQVSNGGSHAAVAKVILDKIDQDPDNETGHKVIEEAFEVFLKKSNGWENGYWQKGIVQT